MTAISALGQANTAAAVGGDRAVAAVWAERAADEAMRRLAFDEADRLYHVALNVGAADSTMLIDIGYIFRWPGHSITAASMRARPRMIVCVAAHRGGQTAATG